MDGYLAKPVRHAELMALAEGLAAGRRAARDESCRRAAPSSAQRRRSRAATAATEPTASDATDRQRASATAFPGGRPGRLAGGAPRRRRRRALLERVVDATLEEGPTLLAELRRLASNVDAAEVHRAAHKLEGTLRTVHDDELIACAEEIEVQAQRGELDRLQERVEDLAGRLEPVFDALRGWRSGGRNPFSALAGRESIG